MKHYILLIALFASPAFGLHASESRPSTGLREGFSNPDTATPETYRDPYSHGHHHTPFTGTTCSFRIQVREYDLNIQCVHLFLNNDEELADLRFRQKHARPLFANYGPDDMTHENGDPVPVSKVDQQTSLLTQWHGTITGPTRLELDFTSMDRALIAQRIAYLEKMQPDKTYARQRQKPFRIVLLLAAVLIGLFSFGLTDLRAKRKPHSPSNYGTRLD